MHTVLMGRDVTGRRAERRRLTVSLMTALAAGAVLAPGAAASSWVPAPGVPFAAGDAQSLAVADLNGDGRTDVLTADVSASTMRVLLAGPDGSLSQVGSPLPVSDTPIALAAGDVNGDGHPDVLTLGGPQAPAHATVDVLLGAGDGTFTPGPAIDLGAGVDPSSLQLADVDEDGHLDALVDDGGSGPAVYLGRGDGTFAFASRAAAAPGPLLGPLGDVDGDGHLDVVHVTFTGLGVARGDGHGTFADDGAFDTQLSGVPLDVHVVRAGNLPDVVAATNDGSIQRAVVLQDRPGPGLAAVFGTPLMLDRSTAALAVFAAPADIDGDGLFDLAGADDAGPAIHVFRNTGTVLQPDTTVTPGTGGIAALQTGDLNGDGRPDLIVLTTGGAITTLLNASRPSLSATTPAFATRQVYFSDRQQSTITNVGEAATRLGTPAISGPTAQDFRIALDTCTNALLRPGDTCRVPIGFQPSAPGERTATLTVAGDGGAQVSVPLTGTGVCPPAATAVAGRCQPRRPTPPATTAKTTAPTCVVPKLVGQRLPGAKRRLRHAHCRLGRVTGAHARHGFVLRVRRQSAKAGRKLPSGAKVSVVMRRARH